MVVPGVMCGLDLLVGGEGVLVLLQGEGSAALILGIPGEGLFGAGPYRWGDPELGLGIRIRSRSSIWL